MMKTIESEGKHMDITIKNPCAFPVEFYSLDFDRQYLEEEEILRQKPISDGYDQFKNLLLPPRCPGDTLPEELLPKKPETPNDENNNEQITQNRTNSIINTDDQKDVEGIKFETRQLVLRNALFYYVIIHFVISHFVTT